MVTSADLIARFEGYRDIPYWDVNAYRAGFGSDTTTLQDGRVVPIRAGMTVNRDDSLRDLDRRITTEFRPSVVNAIGQDAYNSLSPVQQAVLDSLAYNYGAGAWNKGLRGVAQAIATPGHDDDIAAIRALGSHNGGVNERRRNEEADLYASVFGMGPDAVQTASQPGQQQTSNALALQRPQPPQVGSFLDPAAFESQPMNALAGVPQYRISPLSRRA